MVGNTVITMLIRPLTPADANSYSALRHEMLADAPWAFAGSGPVDDPPCDPAHVRTQLANPEHVIVGAWDGARLVGGAGVLRNTKVKFRHVAFIWGVYVTPTCRGQGLSRRIMIAAIDTARAWQGVAVVRLGVSARSLHAKALYESLGFVVWGVEPDCMRLPGREDARGANEFHLSLALEQGHARTAQG